MDGPLPVLRRRELMSPRLRADVGACPGCHDRGDGFVVLCQRHVTEDLFDRL